MNSSRVSPALVISVIALIVAMGGTGYAALKLPKNSVGTKQLRTNAVTGAKVKNGTLTGNDLKLSSLGAVPVAANATNAVTATNAGHAGSADNATHAGSADTVDGHTVKTFSLRLPKGGGPEAALTLGGLTLKLDCGDSGQPSAEAFAADQNSMIRGFKVTDAPAVTDFGQSDLAPGGSVEVFASTDFHGGSVFQYATPAGHVVSVSATFDNTNTFGAFEGCSVTGSAISG